MEAFNFTVANEDCNLYTYDMRRLQSAACMHKVGLRAFPVGVPSQQVISPQAAGSSCTSSHSIMQSAICAAHHCPCGCAGCDRALACLP